MEPSIAVQDVTFWECSVKCNDAVPEVPSAASEQAPTKFPRPVPQPTTTDQQVLQLVAPLTPEPKPAVPKVTPVPTPTSTPSVAPVLLQRSGHAHAAPKCLITEM